MLEEFRGSAMAVGLLVGLIITWQVLDYLGDDLNVWKWIVAILAGLGTGLAVWRLGFLAFRWLDGGRDR